VHALFKSEAFTGLLLRIFSRRLADGFYPIPLEKHRHFAGGVGDYTSVFDLQIDLPGYAIPPHPDVPSKLVTFQFFLPQDDALAGYGTMLCALKGRGERSWLLRSSGSLLTRAAQHFHQEHSRPFKWLERTSVGLELGVGDTANWLPWSRADVVTIAPARRNCFMAFAPNAISYHAVRFDVPPTAPQQERPVVRGFLRAGANTDNWIAPKRM